jgi:signal-transduction protein with cAMP-binding, CBS, and nucleotidyltransferase domain
MELPLPSSPPLQRLQRLQRTLTGLGTDLIRCLAGEGHRLATAVTITLRQLYRPAPELPPTARVSDAARHMFADVSGGVLVTDDGRVLGIVTATDLVRLLARRDTQRTP